MTEEEREDRIVLAFEQAAAALADMARALIGIHDIQQRQFDKQYPRKEKREAVVTSVPTEEDKIREAHGTGTGPIAQWLDLGDAEPGQRERDFLERERNQRGKSNDAGAETASAGGPAAGGAEAFEDQS